MAQLSKKKKEVLFNRVSPKLLLGRSPFSPTPSSFSPSSWRYHLPTIRKRPIEQLSIMFALPRLFVASFTLVLPFFPTGSFERMEEEGDVATAFTMARILSNVPISRGGPTSLVIYDIHALQERFYFGDHVLPCFETGIPLLKRRLHQLPDAENIRIAFPDDGAWKRFYKQLQHFRMIVCNKVREGDKRIVRLKERNPAAHYVVIVDDLLEKRDGTPKDQLSSIKQTLKEELRKREERMKEFCDIQSQIIQVHEACAVIALLIDK
ncbi:hypothetical protein Sjap_000710 [Stephania japonica]|uniref:Uncharacterized protein n=1 Tax=Stephania japonica TaxID=461633 RepID=A0AAP0KJM1_9MAGN